MKKVSRNGRINRWFIDNQVKGYCLKADVKHYFQEVNNDILLNILEMRIKDIDVMQLISVILKNSVSSGGERQVGMPLGNPTSQFFANVYLNELNYFIKYYIRYVDDFVILHSSKTQLLEWIDEIDNFLKNELNLELHPQKSLTINLSRGVDFIGFRNFYYHRLVRKRNVRKMRGKIDNLKDHNVSYWELIGSYQGWQAYVKWADSFRLRKKILKEIYKIKQ